MLEPSHGNAKLCFYKGRFQISSFYILDNFFDFSTFFDHAHVFVPTERKHSWPACGKGCSKTSHELGFFLDSWQCGSLPASGWSGTENRRTVPRNLWGGGLWGHPCISDLKICRNEVQILKFVAFR